MKKLQYMGLAALATLLMAADCSNKDSEFYNDVFVNSPNLIQVETQGPIAVGQNLLINSDNFSNLIQEAGQPNLLNIYKTTGGANSFTFSYLIEQQTGSDWQLYNPGDENIVTTSGLSKNFDDFILAQALFDASSQSYQYHGGVKMNAPGNFRLRFTYNNPVSKTIVLTSDSAPNNLFVTINSDCDDLDGSGYYYFTVN